MLNNELKEQLDEMTKASNQLVSTFDKIEQFTKYQKVLELTQKVIAELYQSTEKILKY